MKNFKNKNGITLIALIITIIVMLILVGVTINVALNGGLFNRAKNARDLTQKQVEKEELMIAALGAYDEKTSEVNLSKLEESINSLSNVYTDKSVKNSKYVLTGLSGTKWQIDLTTAEVKEYKESIPEPDPDPEPEPATPTYPLSGKTFKCALYPSMDTFNIVFSDTTFTWYGETGTYEYNSQTNKITGSITLNSQENEINADLYTSGNNSYFEFGAMGATLPMALDPASESIIPFSGTYTNGSTSYVFSKDTNNYGKVECSGVIPNTNYCYFEETDTIYYGDMRTLTCTHSQDYSTITIDETTYSK